MARRKVAVELVLDARNYLDGAGELLVETKAVEKAVGSLGEQADDTSTDMEQLAANTDMAKRQVDDFGDEARGSAADLKILQERIAATKLSMREMNLEFARTGDDTLSKQIDQYHTLIGRLERTEKEIKAALESDSGGGITASVGGGGKAGGGFISGLVDGISGAGSKPILIAALVALAAAAAPTIGAMIAGAVATAVGTAGLGLGLFAASRNPAVKAALEDFGGYVSGVFFHSAETFSGRFVAALDILKAGFRDLDLDETFRIVAPYIEVVAKGIAGLGTEFMPRFRTALMAARPALEVLGKELPRVGAALGDMLVSMAESKGMVQGIRFLFSLLEGTFRVIGAVVGWLGDRFDDMNKIIAWTTGALEDFVGLDSPLGHFFGGLNDKVERFIGDSKILPIVARDAADGILSVGPAAETASEGLERLTAEFTNFLDRTQALRRATLDMKDGLANLKQQFLDTGGTLDTNTQKGRDNERALRDQIDAAAHLRDEMIKNGVNMQTADIIYQQNIDKINAQAIAAGGSAKAVHAVSDELRNVPKLTIAQLKLQFESSGTLLGEHSGLRLGELEGHRAAGGPVGPGNWVVGDGGRPEVLSLSAGQYGYVSPSVQSYQAAQSSGGWQAAPSQMGGGGGRVDLNVIVKDTSGRTLRKELITDALNRNQPNNVVAAAYP